jgi:hypothetical protein
MMAGADDDAVIGFFQRPGHAVLPSRFAMERTANLPV